MDNLFSIALYMFFPSFFNLHFDFEEREWGEKGFDYLHSSDDPQTLKKLKVVFKNAKGDLPTQLRRYDEFADSYNKYKILEYEEKYGWGGLPSLSDYILPSDEEKIEFRSPERGLPPRGKLTVVSRNEKSKKRGGEYRLAACGDGTVKWLHWLECENNTNHVWTVRWFDKKDGRMVYFGDRLQPYRVKNVNNYYIGGNVNNGSGIQNIGTVDCH